MRQSDERLKKENKMESNQWLILLMALAFPDN